MGYMDLGDHYYALGNLQVLVFQARCLQSKQTESVRTDMGLPAV
jgi:hypothetical protein